MNREKAKRVAAIVRDAGGRVVGRTRLQKIAFLLDAAGFNDGFCFRYKHFGPYSEDLALAARTGVLLGEMSEREELAAWGGTYSIYHADGQIPGDAPAGRPELAGMAAEADAIQLELAATAVFLAEEGYDDPWEETRRRKPQKSDEDRLECAKNLFAEMKAINVPSPLPDIV